MPRPPSTVEGDAGYGFRSDAEADAMLPAFRARLHYLFRQIEKEFDMLYQENQSCMFSFYSNFYYVLPSLFC